MNEVFIVIAVIILTALNVVVCEPDQISDVTGARHIVFFGDSLMRYQYLAYVYRLHFHTPFVPLYVIKEKSHTDWNAFFSNSTDIFNGAMTCDCHRKLSTSQLSSSRENRRYTHPSGQLIVSYFPFMGYFPFQGMNQSSIQSSFGIDVPHPDWKYRTPTSFAQDHLSNITPTPSVIFVNSGHWKNKQIAKNPRKLLTILENIVLSRQGIGSSDSADGSYSSSKEKKEDDVVSGKCVAWLGTTKPNIAWWPGSRDSDWSVLRGGYCRESLASKDGDKENDSPSNKKDMMKACVFVPFSIKVNSTDYYDHMHFSNPDIYHVRTSMALRACNLQNSVYDQL